MFEGAIQYGLNERRSNSCMNNSRGSVLGYIQKSNSLNRDCYVGKSSADIQKSLEKKQNKKAFDKFITFLVSAGAFAAGAFALWKNPAAREKMTTLINNGKEKFTTKFSKENVKKAGESVSKKAKEVKDTTVGLFEKLKTKLPKKAQKS